MGADGQERGGAAVAVVVAVVSWNTRELLDRCLTSLRPAAEAGLATTWVVDNASTDGSPEMVRERHPWVELVASEENLGYGRAVNLVAERTDSEWLVISNADVELAEDALERLLAAAAADPGAGVLAPRLVLPDGTTQHSVYPFPTVGVMLVSQFGPPVVPRRVGDHIAMLGLWDPDRPRRVPWAVGAFLLVRRKAWEASGGFDPEQWMSAEDLELGWQMRKAGWATRYEPGAVVRHAASAAVRARWGEELPYYWQRCTYAWMVRRLGRPRTAAVGAISVAAALGRLLVYVVNAPVRPDRRAKVRPMARWVAVHLYAFAPRRRLERLR
jgi:N-acetylglucosaminyl-diphospho-decaprenol L-rhamnosyltransferase